METTTPQLWILPALPLLGAAINGFFGKRQSRAFIGGVACSTVGLAFLYAVYLFFTAGVGDTPRIDYIAPWISAGSFHADFSLYLDPLSMLMTLVVTGVGFLIHVYATEYKAHEDGFYRFFCYLNLFMFFMLTLVLAGNYLLLFVGWEGVGLCSYLLIGFYYLKQSAIIAGKKAFVVNRIGDFGFTLAMLLIIGTAGSLDYGTVFKAFQNAPVENGVGAVTIICLLLMMGACGKSAQVPLYVWLPDAMEGPTPVSALIHAATMVTAGVYMVARSSHLFVKSPVAMEVVAVIGCITCIFAATIGLVQTDIKRVLAYSTVSQLGYMFLGCGVGAFSAGVFHLMTHAFFKALLFLAAGSVIHAMGGEQDMRHMGGLSKKIKVTYWTMLIATLAIAGFPPLAGFFSKDSILGAAFEIDGGKPLYVIGLLTALLTSFYMFRLVFLTFHGKQRYDEHHVHVHESPWSMLGPLVVLAVLSVIGGWMAAPSFFGGEDHFTAFLAPVFGAVKETASSAEAHNTEVVLAVVAVVAALIGLLTAFWLYLKQPGKPAEIAKSLKPVYNTLYNKYYVDEAYGAAIVKPLLALSTSVLWKVIDVEMIDGTVNGVAHGAAATGDITRRTQSGNTRSYAVWVVAGALVVIAIIFWPAIRAFAGGAQ